jgi:2-amino-4-hydroxy-6-hydroxymethyldihydropteridine diphosphokinase
MPDAYISVGSNINAKINLIRSLRLLSVLVKIKGISPVYVTEAENRPRQHDYLNCVIQICTRMKPLQLKYNILRRIEALLGRKRTKDKFAARTIDLDLIVYGKVKSKSSKLSIPDPVILKRQYIALGLYKLNPGLNIPGLGKIKKIVSEFGKSEYRQVPSLFNKKILDFN